MIGRRVVARPLDAAHLVEHGERHPAKVGVVIGMTVTK
jgi:hypothetical protein